MADQQLSNNEADRRYEMRVDGDLAGYAEYESEPGRIRFTHTRFEPRYEGQGLASRLARYALDDVRARGLKAVPQCRFIASYIERHPQDADLVAG